MRVIRGIVHHALTQQHCERLASVVSYCTHGITNAVAEGINSEIQSIKRRVGCYRNPENSKNAIFFYCGGLDLHPR
ncbi:MAG: transposase [Planctomycetota bacterium]